MHLKRETELAVCPTIKKNQKSNATLNLKTMTKRSMVSNYVLRGERKLFGEFVPSNLMTVDSRSCLCPVDVDENVATIADASERRAEKSMPRPAGIFAMPLENRSARDLRKCDDEWLARTSIP